MSALPTVLDVAGVATLLRCAETTVEERARRGELPGLKIGESWVFPAGALTVRLDQLALEQAAERRKPARPSGQLVPIKPKAKRTPPALPPP
jgi:Helix-turn-helix domain